MANMGIKDEILEEVQDLDARMTAERKKQDGSRMGIIDLLTEKIVSRKLTVWVVATVMLFMHTITPDDWQVITVAYIGMEGVTDMMTKFKSAGK